MKVSAYAPIAQLVEQRTSNANREILALAAEQE
jgi:hypothetical protein